MKQHRKKKLRYRFSSRLPARPDRPASRTKLTPVLLDHGVVSALGAQPALHHLGRAVAARRFEDAHLARRQPFFRQHAEHGVAVDDQARQIRHRRRPGLLAALAGDEGHEVA